MMVATSPLIKSVSLGRVDCTQEKQLCASQQVSAFPTLRVYRQHDTHSHENYHGDRTVDSLKAFIVEAHHSSDNYEFHPLTHLTHTSGEGCMVHGRVTVSRVPGSMRLSAQSLFHSFDPLGMNVTHHVDAMLFAAPGAECPHLKAVTQAEQVWANDEQFSCAYRRAMNALIDHRDALARGAERAPVGEATLLSSRFVMHEQAMTLKHYLKVVPYHYTFVDGETHHTYMYKANYNEYRPRKLEWYEGKADAHVDTQLVRHASHYPPPPTRPASTPSDACVARLRQVPNAVFHYDISPVMVVVNEETQSFASFVTKICAVIGGIYTVIGLVDNTIYHTGSALKKHL